jgi:N-acyl-D-amino-acid deacylase
MRARQILAALLAAASLGACAGAGAAHYDVIISGGAVYDGTGAAPVHADVAIEGDRVAAIGDLSRAGAGARIDASGMAVVPGFINMLSWATDSLLQDGRSQSDIRQGVTLEVMGEGESMGALNDAMRRDMIEQQTFVHYDPTWTTLGEYLETLERRGVSTNVASYVGATTVRIHEIGYADRPPTPDELARMQDLVRQAMREGALGVGSSLIYAPAFYAGTDELIALVAAAREYDGGYISHIRSEGDRYLEALDELIAISRATGARAQVYHLKPAGEANWGLSEAGLARLDAARAEGLDITADVYTYNAGATGLDASMPPWVQEGGLDAWVNRLRDPAIRARVLGEMRAPAVGWESLYQLAGGAQNVILIGFKNPSLRRFTGMTLAQVAAARGQSPEDAMIDLVIEDHHRVDTAYVVMSEANIERNLRWPHTMLGSDAGSIAPEEPFTQFNPHPRAYGNFARFLGRYVRDRQLMPLEEAIRRLTSLPADSIAIRERGRLQTGYYADIVVFDPATIIDHATFAEPHQYSTGVRDVFVNGVQVLRDGEHTGATPGRVVRGPGWTGWADNP